MTEPTDPWANRLRTQEPQDYKMDVDEYRPSWPPNLDKKFTDLIDAKAEDVIGTVNMYLTDPELADYFFDDDEAVQDARQYYERARNNAPQYAVSHSGKGVKGDTISKAGVERVFGAIRKDNSLESPTNPKTGKQLLGVGMWQDHITISQPAEKDAAYDLILLNMISQVFLNYVKSVEIEAMCVADRVVVSANKIGDIPKIRAQSLAEAIEKVPKEIEQKGGRVKELYEWQINKHIDIQRLRSSLRTGVDANGLVLDIVTAANLFPDSYQSTISALKVIAADKIKNAQTTPAGLRAYLVDNSYVCSIILVEPINESHAEQNLMLGLIKSGYNTGADVAIAGGKRPCTICYLSLMITKERYPHLRFGINPGGLYMNETKGGLAAICNALGINEELLIEKAKGYLGPTHYGQFMTGWKELDEQGLAQVIARKGKDVTVQHQKTAKDIMATQQLRREDTLILDGLEAQGISSKQPTVVLHPPFDRKSFGEYEGTDEMDTDYSSSEEEDETSGPADQETIYEIGSTKDLQDLLARAKDEGWLYVFIKNADPNSQIVIEGDASTPVRLKAGANVVVSDHRHVVIDDDGVRVSLRAGKLSMENYHQTQVNIEGTGEATMFTRGDNLVRINSGILYIKGYDAASPARVELHGGAVAAYENTIIGRVGSGGARIVLQSSKVRIGPRASLGGVEILDYGNKPELFD